MVLNRRLFVFVWMIAALAASCAGRAETNMDYVRLHVVAADDTAEAQALKLQVRDAVLQRARALLQGCDSADSAWEAVNANIAALTETVRAAARAGGETARCETGVFAFPNRRYGNVLVPAGDYRALRVVIGRGAGRNWWCVLYPGLCYVPDAAPQDPPVFYSSIWNWLKGLFGGGEA